MFLRLHDGGVWVWQIFFAAHLLILGSLIWASGFFPRLLGLGRAIGGLGYMLDSAYAFAFPDADWLGWLRAGLLAVVTLSEITFARWRVIAGPRQSARMAELMAT